MTDHKISKTQARQILEEYFAKQARHLEISDVDPGGIYKSSDEECWYVHVPSETHQIGASRFIVISKHTGRIVYDGFVGE